MDNQEAINYKFSIMTLIFTHSHGKGGHYFSFNSISKELMKSNKIFPVEIGWGKRSPALLELSQFVSYTPFSILKTVDTIKDIIKENGIQIIHCFDEHAFLIARLASFSCNVKVVLTRCGGANPKKYYPKSDWLICFSKENESFFNLKQYRNVFLIPNRCDKNDLVSNETTDVKFKSLGANKFLSIARIGDNYYRKHSKAIELIKRLTDSSKKYNVSLTICGEIESDSIFEKLKSEASGRPVSFVTNKEITKKASVLIASHDYVIGTGRGVMEAMALGKTLLIVTRDNEIPVLITDENFYEFFSSNFSLRSNKISSDSIEQNRIEALISSTERKAVFSKKSETYFEKYFDIKRINPMYQSIYQDVLNEKRRKKYYLDTFLNFSHNFIYYLTNRKYRMK